MKKAIFRGMTIVFFANLFIFGLLIAEEAKNGAPAIALVRPTVEYNADEQTDPFMGIEEPKIEEVQAIKQEEPVTVETPKAEPVPPRIIPLPNLKVQGLVLGGIFPLAVINEKVVKIGDEIEGATVKKIEKKNVTLIFQQREFSIPSPSAQTPAVQLTDKGGKDGKKF